MTDKTTLLILSVLFFACLAKDIAVPAVVLLLLAGLRWLGSADLTLISAKGASR